MSPQLFPAFGDRPWVMGILNVTPDSFSDGGRWADPDAAVRRGLALIEQGADLIDIGGESTRPGAHRVDPDTEAARVLPVITMLSEEGVVCSVDTTRAVVAAQAVEAGASIINDVSGGRADPNMFAVAAHTQVPLILMHWRGHSARMADLAVYHDVFAEVRDELLTQVELALHAGVNESSLILDPGLGFAKTAAQSWILLRRLAELVELGLPVLVGASRKRFLAAALDSYEHGYSSDPRSPAQREVATAATSLISAQHGAWGVRVHEPLPSGDVFKVLRTMRTSSDPIALDADWDRTGSIAITPLVVSGSPARIGSLNLKEWDGSDG